jgi:hypothetical protein
VERRHAWQQARPNDPVDGADIVYQDHADGPLGARTWVGIILAPLSDRGRTVIPAPRRVSRDHVRALLADLRGRGLVVMREGG